MVLENDAAKIERNIAFTHIPVSFLLPSTVALTIAGHTQGAKHLFVTSDASASITTGSVSRSPEISLLTIN